MATVAAFYAYVHARPDGRIFYAGKGNSFRVSKIDRRNRHHQNIVNKYGAENILVGKMECSSEDIAFELEKGLIKCLRRSDVRLVNRTDGGDGVSGLKFSDESREKMSTSAQFRFQNPEERQKQSIAQRKRFEDPIELKKLRQRANDPIIIEKYASKNRGKVRSLESKAKMSESAKMRQTPEARKAHSERMKAAWADPEKRKRMEETKARNRAERDLQMIDKLGAGPWRNSPQNPKVF